MPRRIALDIDGVVADILTGINGRFGEAQNPSEYRMEQMYPSVPEEDIVAFVSDPITYLRLEPIEGAREGFRALCAAGHQPVYITHRPVSSTDVTDLWLASHEMSAPVFYADDKALYCQTLGVEVAVDDSYDIAVSLSHSCKYVLLYNQVYNKGPNNGFVRVHSWEALVTWVTGQHIEFWG